MAAGLMIFGTPPIGKGPEGFATSRGCGILASPPARSEAEIDDWLCYTSAPNFKPIPHLRRGLPQDHGAARGCLARRLGMLQDETAIVRDLKIPLAIVQGAEEQIVDLGYLQRLSAPGRWRGKVQVIEGSGHTPLGAAEGVRKTAGCVRVDFEVGRSNGWTGAAWGGCKAQFHSYLGWIGVADDRSTGLFGPVLECACRPRGSCEERGRRDSPGA